MLRKLPAQLTYISFVLALVLNFAYPLFSKSNIKQARAAVVSVSLSPIADSFASASSPTTNYGTRTTLEIDGSPVKPGFVKFDLTSLSGKAITLAKFQFTVRDGSVSTFNFKSLTDNSWNEQTITYQNMPTPGSTFATQTGFTAAAYTEVVMTDYMAANAGSIVSFAVDSPGNDGYSYYSRQSTTNKPSLYIEYSDPLPSIIPSPSPTPTPSPIPSVIPSPVPSPSPSTSPVILSSSLLPLADAYVYVSSPSGNFGTRTTIETDGNPIKIGYLKFDLSNFADKVITLAKYRYFVKDGSVGTFNYKEVTDTSWGEKTLTYNNKPSLGATLATHPTPAANTASEIDLTSYAVSHTGQIISLGIDTQSSDGYSLYTKESSINKPSLYIEYYDPNPPPVGPVIAVAGDIACNSTISTATTCQHQQTSDLIMDLNPEHVLELGDMQYGSSTLPTIMSYYDPTWGRFKAKTHPILGNHEDNLTAYFDYWNGLGLNNGAAGERGKGYYSFDIANWHVVALNTNCTQVPGGCGVGSAQESWLRADLAAHSNQCTVAMMHHAYYTSGSAGTAVEVKPLVQALYDANADLILAGHKHMYERFAPQTPENVLDTNRGIRSFTVGTGGKDLNGLGNSNSYPNLQLRNGQTFGILKMVLGNGSYSWQFIPTPGGTFTDSGTGLCH